MKLKREPAKHRGARVQPAFAGWRHSFKQLANAIDVLPEGFALFDAEERYVIWNQRYAEMLGPAGATIAAGARYEDVLREALKNGYIVDAVGQEEAWLTGRLEDFRRASHAFEDRSHDGERIFVRERRTADGGRLTIHSDINVLKQSKSPSSLVFESNPVPMFVCRADTLAFIAANAAAVDHYGYSKPQFSKMSVLDLRRPDDREDIQQRLKTGDVGLQNGTIRRHLKADGTEIDVEVYAAAMSYNGVPAVIVAAIDVTARLRADAERQHAEAKHRAQKVLLDTAMDNMAQGLAMFDAAGRLALWNQRYIDMYHLPPGVIRVGCSFTDFMQHRKDAGLYNGDPEELFRQNRKRVKLGKPWTRVHHLADGRSIQAVQRPIGDGGWVSTHEDITERLTTQRQIEHLAHYDTLTGLPNRASFTRFLQNALTNASQQGDKLAILSIDLDRLKEVNDVFGHAAGDLVLKEVAARLESVVGGAFVARLSGDEFSIVITGEQQLKSVEDLAKKLHATMAMEISLDGHVILCSFSIGVATFPSDGTDTATLLANGDAALYRAKREGRARTCFFDSQMDKQLRDRHALQQELRQAIENGELAIEYQPQARTTGEITGFEALARWQNPVRGLIGPNVFIPIAEENGFIIRLGEWVLFEACREAATWKKPLNIAVNLSPVQFIHGNLPALAHAALLETGLAPHRLELEITESVLIDDFTRATSVLLQLKALGIKIAMDDFGTGYSSLSYLHSVPFDKIKIDRSFVAQLEKNSNSSPIIRAMIGLAHGLSLPVLVEGVETKEQLEFLKQEDCDEIQGLFIGGPRTIDEYADVVGTTHRTAGTPAKRAP